MVSSQDFDGVWRVVYSQRPTREGANVEAGGLLGTNTVYIVVSDGRFAGVTNFGGCTLAGKLQVGANGRTVSFESTWDLRRADENQMLPGPDGELLRGPLDTKVSFEVRGWNPLQMVSLHEDGVHAVALHAERIWRWQDTPKGR